MKKRILSIILSIVMLVSLLPATAFAIPATHSHAICGAEHTDIGDHTGSCEDIPWTAWDGGSISTSGNYYLSSSPASTPVIDIGTDGGEAITVKLCLNGQTLSVERLQIMNATVDLCDCSNGESGKIIGTETDYTVYQYGTSQTEFNMYGGTISGISKNGAVNVYGYEADHTFNMYGGTVTNAYSNTQTGAVSVYGAGGKFNMYGGTIKDCTGKCSGVYASYGATVTMAGGTIENNNAGTYGGGVYLTGWTETVPTFTMTGGSITNNQGANGGGVYITYGTFNMSGTAAISNNQSANGGGGVHMYHSAYTSVVNTFNMTGGSITNNTGLTGGGVDMGGGSASAFTMTGGTISGNTATGSGGGGVFLRKGTLSVSGTAAIADNTAKNGGGVYLNGGTLTMTGGEITGNSANNYSGGVYNKAGKFNVSGSPVVTDNKVGTAENNIYCVNDITITGALTTDAQIGVNYSSATTFTSGWNTYMAGKEENIYEYFTPDDSAKYGIRETDGELELYLLHEHGGWTYSYADGTITATCGVAGCPLNGDAGTATCNVTIDTNVEYKYSGYDCPVGVVTPSNSSDWVQAGLAIPTVKNYRLTEEPLEGSATITVDGEEACTVPFTLIKGTLTAADITLIPPNDRIYSGSAKEVTFSTWGDATHLVTVYYEGEGLVNGKPVNAGTYTVKVNVEGSEWYNAINGLNIGSFDIAQKDISADDVTFEAIPDQYYTGRDVQPKPIIKYNGMTLVEDTDYRISSYENNIAVGTGASVVINGIGNYLNSKTVSFSISYDTKAAGEVFKDYDESKWFNVENAPVFTTKDGWTVSETAPVGEDTSVAYSDEGENVSKTVYVKDSTGKIYQVTLNYKYDKTEPTFVAEVIDGSVWTNESRKIEVTVGETLSGVKSVELYIGDVKQDVAFELVDGHYYCTVTENGNYKVKVTDNAGNYKFQSISIAVIDKAAPSLQIGVPTGTDGNDGWFTSAVTVPVTAGDGDGESGLDKWYYSLNGGTDWTEGSGTGFKISADGDYSNTVKIKAVDMAGNETVTTIAELKIDTTAPSAVTVTAKVGGDDYVSGEWTTGDVAFTLSASDATSGIQKYQYTTDGGETWTDITGNTYTHTASTDETGVTYKFRAVDNAGNVGEASDSITIKKRQPYTITFNANGGTGNMDSLTAYVDTQIELTENAFTREGYTFAGWNTAADGSGTAYADKANVTNLAEMNQTAILYAQWAVNEYKVTWINYGDDGWEKYFDYGESITLPTIPDFAIMMHKLGYTQTGWLCSDDTVEIGDTMPAKDLTFTAQYTPNTYTVKFDANGGTGEMADQSFTYDAAAQALTTNAYTREGYKFVGWAELADSTGVDYVDKQVVSNLNAAPNGEVILYAVWTRDIILSGDIVAPNVSDAENLDVVLVGLDGTEYPVSVTGSQSPYHYTVTVPEGEYQLIVKDTQNDVTVTAKEDLSEDKTEEPITMPTDDKSSIVNSDAAGEYKPIVGGLDAVAESTRGTSVVVTLTVTHEPTNEEDTEHDALMDAAGGQKSKLTFLEIGIVKKVDSAPEEPITQTDNAIEIVIPFDTTRKQNFKVYRFHDGTVDVLTTTANTDGEYIEIGTGSVTIHAKKFSLYAIGYTDVIPYYPVAHSCTSKCDVCGGCEDAACTENACKGKCRLLGMNFTDVADGKWYTEPVAYVYHHKMMEGVGNNIFDINGNTTRAMIVTILWRLEGEPVVNYLMQFEDIPADTWYTEAVRWAASEKIVEGYSDTAFGPTDPITREQFATILWRYAKYKGYDVSVGEDTNILSYEDAFSISEYAIPAMQWACGAGLMQGDGVNLTPKADATRAQAAALFQRFCENVAEK